MAWDRYNKTGRSHKISIDFYTGTASMFAVKKYSDALNELRLKRGVGAFFEHNLVALNPDARKATFKKPDGTSVEADYNLLHVSPPMGPLEVIKNSPIADQGGWVAVDQGTLRHTNPEYGNVWALGDCSSLPTSKTAAAITGQAPVLTENLFSVVDTGKVSGARYDGYTSCPVSYQSWSLICGGACGLTGGIAQLLTGYGELMLAEFKYGAEPKETFASVFGDQSIPRTAFYHLKKDFFPYVYWKYMVCEMQRSSTCLSLTCPVGQGQMVRHSGPRSPYVPPVDVPTIIIQSVIPHSIPSRAMHIVILRSCGSRRCRACLGWTCL